MLRTIGLMAILISTIILAGQVGRTQPPGTEPLPTQASPRWLPVPGVEGVEYAPDLKSDLFRYGGDFYRYQDGRWHKGKRIEGPWRSTRRIPPPFYRIGRPYFKTPPGWAKGKKTGWGGAPIPPGQMKKYR